MRTYGQQQDSFFAFVLDKLEQYPEIITANARPRSLEGAAQFMCPQGWRENVLFHLAQRLLNAQTHVWRFFYLPVASADKS
jgi:hypothetical protein